MKRTATESLAAAALQAPQAQSSQTDYNVNYEPHQDATVVATEAASNSIYGGAPTGTSFAFSNGGASLTSHQQGNNMFDQQVYTASDDTSLAPTHAVALAAAAASGTPEPRRRSSYAFSNVQAANSNTYNAPYNGTTPNDWVQWSRANVRQIESLGDYPNVSSTVHPPHGRTGSPTQGGAGGVDGPPMQGSSRFGQWPAVVFPDAKGHIAGGHQ